MKITKLTIFGYGKWTQKTFDLTYNPIVILGLNESGKSTIQSFIRHILFGFPKFRKQAEYVPKEMNEYGGRLYVTDETYGEIIIERVRKELGSSVGDVTVFNSSGEILPEAVVSNITKHLTLDMYDRFFSLQLDDLNQLTSVNKEELNKYFLTIGTTGSDYLFQLHDKWLDNSRQLYKPTGNNPPLNQKVDALLQLSQKVADLESKQQMYRACLTSEEHCLLERDRLQLEEQKTKEGLYQLEADRHLWSLLQEHDALHSKYQEHIANLPVDLMQRYERLKVTIQELKQQGIRYKERQQEINLTDNEAFSWYLKHKTEIKQNIQRLPQIERFLQQALAVDVERSAKEDSLIEEKQRLGLSAMATLPRLSDEQLHEAEAWQEKSQQFSQQEQLIQQQLTVAQMRLSEQESRLQQITKRQECLVATKQNRLLSIIGTIVIVGSLSVGVFMQQWILAVIGLGIAVLFGLVEYAKYKKQQVVIQRVHYWQEMYQQEHEQLEKYQVNVQEFQQALQQLTKEKMQLNADVAQWKKVNGIPTTIAISDVASGMLKQAQRWEHDYQVLNEKRALFNQQAQEYVEWFAFYRVQVKQVEMKYLEDCSTLDTLRHLTVSFKQYVDKMMVEEAKTNQQAIRQTQVARDVQLIEEKLLQLEQDKLHLFQQFGQVNDEDQFVALLAEQQQQLQYQQKLEWLQQQLGEHEQRLRHYGDDNAICFTIQEKEKTLQIVQQQLLITQEQLASIRQEKRQLEEDGTYAEVVQDYAFVEDEVLHLVKEVGECLMGAKLIEVLLQSNKQTHLQQVIEDAEHYFRTLTLSRYRHLVFTKQSLSVQREDLVSFDLKELSRGTLEQLYIALRLAFIKNIQEHLNLPILIDDCLVNFDYPRRMAMYRILEEFSQTHQIFYFTFNDEINQYLQHKQIIYLQGE